MVGQLTLERGRWGGAEAGELYGLTVLRTPADPAGWLGQARLRRAGRNMERGGVRRALVPAGFEGWLEEHGLARVDPLPLVRNQSAPLALELLRRQGREPSRAVVALRGTRADREMELAALRLSSRVRRLVIAAPRGGAELAARLRWELGIPILPPESEAGVAVCFAPEEDVPAQSVLALHGARPGLGGLELTAPGLREGDRGDLPLLTALWEGGRLTERDLKIT